MREFRVHCVQNAIAGRSRQQAVPSLGILEPSEGALHQSDHAHAVKRLVREQQTQRLDHLVRGYIRGRKEEPDIFNKAVPALSECVPEQSILGGNLDRGASGSCIRCDIWAFTEHRSFTNRLSCDWGLAESHAGFYEPPEVLHGRLHRRLPFRVLRVCTALEGLQYLSVIGANDDMHF